MSQPILRTARLVLRPFEPADAKAVQHLAGAPEVADTTQNIPHPYEDGMAEAWIATHSGAFERRESVVLAITHPTDGIVGALNLRLEMQHERAEIGYWIGVPFWGRGYATEAVREGLRYGFLELGLHRIYATHMTRNPASGRVMQKAGMRHEGRHREHVVVKGRHEDIEVYGILGTEHAPRTE